MASAPLPPVPPVPGVVDAWTVRRAGALCAIGVAVFLTPALVLVILTAAARTVSIGRGAAELLLFFAFPAMWLAAGILGAAAILTVAVHARRAGPAVLRAALPFLTAGIVVAFAAPEVLVLLTRQASSDYWWGVYLGFLPAALLCGAQVALLGPVTRWRQEPRALWLATGAAVGVWGAPAVFWLFFSYYSTGVFFVAVGVCTAAAVLDGVLYAIARLRTTPPWPVPGPPVPP